MSIKIFHLIIVATCVGAVAQAEIIPVVAGNTPCNGSCALYNFDTVSSVSQLVMNLPVFQGLGTLQTSSGDGWHYILGCDQNVDCAKWNSWFFIMRLNPQSKRTQRGGYLDSSLGILYAMYYYESGKELIVLSKNSTDWNIVSVNFRTGKKVRLISSFDSTLYPGLYQTVVDQRAGTFYVDIGSKWDNLIAVDLKTGKQRLVWPWYSYQCYICTMYDRQADQMYAMAPTSDMFPQYYLDKVYLETMNSSSLPGKGWMDGNPTRIRTVSNRTWYQAFDKDHRNWIVLFDLKTGSIRSTTKFGPVGYDFGPYVILA